MQNIFPSLSQRFGVCFDYYNTGDTVQQYPLFTLSENLWYQDYNYSPHGNSPIGEGLTGRPSDYPYQYQVVWNVGNYSSGAGTAALGTNANTYKGRKWLFGNEPDNAGQSNNTPTQYANGYYQAYKAIKTKDPTAMIYFGGISQMSPMRLRYLDQVLIEYQSIYGTALPCDGVQVHGYIIQEELGYPGIGLAVGIPALADGRKGTAWDNHTNINVFTADIYAMRTWMKSKGFQDKPLIVSEYGSLLPAIGWGSTPEVQGQYLEDTFEFMLHAEDSIIGCSLDNNLLVQGFAWYSVQSNIFPDGMLFTNYELNALGKYYSDFYSNYNDFILLENKGNLLKEDIWLIQK